MIMWLGELITQRGIGNGMSILIFSSVVSRLPAQGSRIFAAGNYLQFVTVLLMGVAMIVGIIFVEQGQRRIPVQFAKRVVGRRMYGGQSTTSRSRSISPASSPSSSPARCSTFRRSSPDPALGRATKWIQDNIVSQRAAAHILGYGLLIIFFAYFYTAIAFNPPSRPTSSANRGASSPASAQGRRPSGIWPRCSNRITLPGRCSWPPSPSSRCWSSPPGNIQQFPFGGTAILITVGVALETMKQIDSQLMMRNYEGFLR